MLAATRLLLAGDTPFSLRSLACRAVVAAGGPDDVAALLVRMLAAPDELVCWALMARGTRDIGEQLYKKFIERGALRGGVPEVVLHALGYLGVAEAEPVLWTAAHAPDHYVHQSACLGLVDLPCVGREGAIADAIRACHGRNLFGEFWPALAGKVGDPSLIAPFLADGSPISTDCFGGVLLGIASLGERDMFERVLFDPFWEAVDGPTGNRRWCDLGVRTLGLSICQLLRARRDAIADDAVDILAALALLHASPSGFPGTRAALPPVDDDLSVHTEFFLVDGSLIDVARRRDRRRALQSLEVARAALAERLACALAADGPHSNSPNNLRPRSGWTLCDP
jgi:hypothetical protein